MGDAPVATFMFRGAVVMVTVSGRMLAWTMLPVMGEYNWYDIGMLRLPNDQ